MHPIQLLIELASTPIHHNPLTDLLTTQPLVIQQAFVAQNAAALKQCLMSNPAETFTNERTVATF